jgi:hypothetical protein
VKTLYVFAYDRYHAQGGFRDFIGRFASLREIKDYLREENGKRGSLVSSWQEIQIVQITEETIQVIEPGIVSVEQNLAGHEEAQEQEDAKDVHWFLERMHKAVV